MKETRVLITGVSGFIGKNLLETLLPRENLYVVGVSRNPIGKSVINPYWWHIGRVDLMDKEDAVRITKDVDIIIHAAAISAGAKYIVGQPDFQFDNTTINTNILQAAYANGVKHFIFLSCSVLYPMDLGRPVREDDFDIGRIHPKYHAGAWIKIYGEELCRFYSGLGRTRFTVIRHSNIYGPYDKFDLERGHVFASTIAKVMNAHDGGKIVVWGEGAEERDLLHVSDLTSFIERVIASADWQYQVFNVGYGRALSVADLTAKIISASGKNLSIEYDKSKPAIENSKLTLDISKAMEKLGWQPEVGLEDGIRETIDWYKRNYQREAPYEGN